MLIKCLENNSFTSHTATTNTDLNAHSLTTILNWSFHEWPSVPFLLSFSLFPFSLCSFLFSFISSPICFILPRRWIPTSFSTKCNRNTQLQPSDTYVDIKHSYLPKHSLLFISSRHVCHHNNSLTLLALLCITEPDFKVYVSQASMSSSFSWVQPKGGTDKKGELFLPFSVLGIWAAFPLVSSCSRAPEFHKVTTDPELQNHCWFH